MFFQTQTTGYEAGLRPTVGLVSRWVEIARAVQLLALPVILKDEPLNSTLVATLVLKFFASTVIEQVVSTALRLRILTALKGSFFSRTSGERCFHFRR